MATRIPDAGNSIRTGPRAGTGSQRRAGFTTASAATVVSTTVQEVSGLEKNPGAVDWIGCATRACEDTIETQYCPTSRRLIFYPLGGCLDIFLE